MKRVYKYPIMRTDSQLVSLPEEANILYADMQNATLCLWAEVHDDIPHRLRKILVRGTGHPFTGEERRYIGTARDGVFVWHIYEGE